MQELVGRLTALDPEASETLKVVSYFDALVTGQVSVEVLARSAAVLAGCPAGVSLDDGSVVRMSPAGDRLPVEQMDPSGTDWSTGWATLKVASGERVWIERAGGAHANDSMLLERFAMGVAITRSRASTDSGSHRAIEMVVDGKLPPDVRAEAATRLRLGPQDRVRAVALPATADEPVLPSAVLSTPFGVARVVLMAHDARWDVFRAAGIGTSVEPSRLPASWSSALVALRLSDSRSPIVDAEHLGALLLLAEAADAAPQPHPDVLVLDAIAGDRSSLPTLDALQEEGSVRAAAAILGVHHSTVQSRLTALVETLGYDPRTAEGRTRYALARVLQRLRSGRL